MITLDEALASEKRVWDAVVAGDGDGLGHAFADDYVEVTAEGRRVLKSDVVQGSPVVDDIARYEIAHAAVVPAGADAVLLSYHLFLDGTLRGAPIDPPYRWVVSCWRREGDALRCCFFQQTHADDSD